MAHDILQSGDLGAQRATVRYIMVVDDDAESALETKAILDQAGFEAKVFKDVDWRWADFSADRRSRRRCPAQHMADHRLLY